MLLHELKPMTACCTALAYILKISNAHSKQDVRTHSFAVRYNWFLIFTLAIPTVKFNAPANIKAFQVAYFCRILPLHLLVTPTVLRKMLLLLELLTRALLFSSLL